MKEIIVVYGNMGSGKSTFAKALNKQLPDFKYVCLDDHRRDNFADVLDEDHSSFEFEKKVKKEMEDQLGRYSRIIYETTGGTDFFRKMYYEFVKQQYEVTLVKTACPLDECLRRHEKRERRGHFHVVPKYKKALSPYEAIRKFDEKSAWIRPDVVLDSVKYSAEELVSQFMMANSKEDKGSELRKLIADFDYDRALTWYKQHVEGKFFIKQLLDKGEDDYNRGKLKAELNLALESLESKPLPEPSMEADPEETTPEERTLPRKILPKIVENAPSSMDDQKLKEEWRPKFAEANQLFAQLDYIQDKEERKTKCFELLDLMDEVEKTWQKADFLKKYGQMPNFDNAGVDQLTTNQAATRIRTLRTYISKAKKGILKDERVPEWEAEIKELELLIR